MEIQEDTAPENQELEREARSMGWQPEVEFKGNKDHWVTAQDFVERGRAVMPILLKNNKRLHAELLTRDEKLATLEASLGSFQTAMQKMERHYTDANKRAVENAKRELKNELKQARLDNDVEAEFDIQEKLTNLNIPVPVPPTPKVETAEPAQNLTPEFKIWNAENPWFGTDNKKTKAIMRVAEDLREDGSELVGVEFMDECLRVLEASSAALKPTYPAGKVESTARAPRQNNSKSFSSLPAEAKQACHEDAEDFVGANKRYKTLQDWENQYAKIYYSE